jgi:hypothetical protein
VAKWTWLARGKWGVELPNYGGIYLKWFLPGSYVLYKYCSRARDVTLARGEIIKIRRGVAVG